MNTTWKAHRVSPMYKFKYSEGHFKSYAQALTAALHAESRRGEGVAVSLPESEAALGSGLHATMTTLKVRAARRKPWGQRCAAPAARRALTCPLPCNHLQNVAVNGQEPEAILITVEKPSTRGGQSVALKLVLCSVGAPERVLPGAMGTARQRSASRRSVKPPPSSLTHFLPRASPAEPEGADSDFVHLPVALLKGPVSVARQVFSWLQVGRDHGLQTSRRKPTTHGPARALTAPTTPPSPGHL